MAVKSINCPNCGHTLTVSWNQDIVECSYCKSSVAVREQINIKQTVDVGQLLYLCTSAFQAGNYQEAYDYATKILEYDTINADAWMFKGMAVMQLSTLTNNRMSEAVEIFLKVLNAPDDVYKEQLVYIAGFVNEFTKGFFHMLKERTDEIKQYSDNFKVISDNILNIKQSLVLANNFNPDDVSILKNIVEVNNYFIPYMHDKKRFQQENEKYIALIRKEEPNYTPPSASGSCFIVTATMGDTNHPRVAVLQNFRDKVLLEYRWGNSFITWYYQHGPSIANFIADKRLFRYLSYLTIVMPASEIAKLLLKSLRIKR